MSASDVFQKTPIGWQEIESRGSALSRFSRSTLILCDGRRTVLDLVSMLGHDTLLEQSLRALSELRLISRIEPPPGSAAMAATLPDALAWRAPFPLVSPDLRLH